VPRRRIAALTTARAAYADRLENFSSDWNHLNVRGQAAAAEITLPAVAALLQL
jgi:hypothetical protein